jgi:hypothetical protein
MAELGTEGSIDGNQRLVIKGKFVPKVGIYHAMCCWHVLSDACVT